jgi:membrane-bound lytic murein transglycosylase D
MLLMKSASTNSVKKNLLFILIASHLASCATTESKKPVAAKDTAVAVKKIPGPMESSFTSESVREAYFRLKKQDPSAEEIKTEVEETTKLVKIKSKSMIDGAATVNVNGQYSGKTYFLEGANELQLENNYFDIPVTYNEQVKKWMNFFLNRGRGFFERYTERAGRYAPILGAILEEHGLPRDLIFLAMAESGFNTSAKSWAKAVGPWQFMPYTGKVYGLEQDWYRDERRDPIKATVAAARYLTKLYDDFGSWEVAAAAYNAGEGKMSRAITKYKSEDFWDLTKGKYLKSETKNYVPKIMALAIIGKNLKSFGFDDIDFHEPLDFDEISVKPATDLIKLSEALQVDFEEIQRLNPEVMRWFTPPNIAEYKLRIPPNTAEKFAQCCAKLDFIASDFQEFVIPKKGMNISELSKKFKIKKNYVLASLNKVSEGKVFSRGEVVKLPFRIGEHVSPSNNLYADLFEKPRREILRKSSRLRYRRYAHRKKAQGHTAVKKADNSFSVIQKKKLKMKRVVASEVPVKKVKRWIYR